MLIQKMFNTKKCIYHKCLLIIHNIKKCIYLNDNKNWLKNAEEEKKCWIIWFDLNSYILMTLI